MWQVSTFSRNFLAWFMLNMTCSSLPALSIFLPRHQLELFQLSRKVDQELMVNFDIHPCLTPQNQPKDELVYFNQHIFNDHPGYMIDLPTSCDGSWFTSSRPNILNTDKGIKLMLATRSQSALSMEKPPIVQWIIKLLGSFYFWGSFFWRNALHSSFNFTILYSFIFIFFDIISLKNLA